MCPLTFNQCSSSLNTNGISTLSSSSENPSAISPSRGIAIKCTTPNVGASFPRRAWRLTGSQYINSVKSAFASVQSVTNPFRVEAVTGAFRNNSDGLNIGLQLTADLIAENEKIGAAAVSGLVTAYPCLASTINLTCSNSVVSSVVSSLFRRPITATELSTYSQFLMSEASLYGNTDGISAFVQASLLSPNFLFRYEIGDRLTGILDPYEKAALISFSAADSAPDAELMDAAKNGALKTTAQIKSHFIRLAKKSNRYETLIDFLQQYLHYSAITTKTKDQALFPNFNVNVAKALVAETDALVIDMMRSGTGTISELLSTDNVMVQPLTASIYAKNASSLPAGTMTKIKDSSRAGILTQPSFLASHGGTKNSSPVQIGKLIRTEILCGKLGRPPVDPPTLDAIPETSFPTQRERLTALHSKGTCYGCHRLMDPIGLGFENFDAVGAIRTTENGYPIDDSGEITYTNSALDGAFNGGAELGRRLASSEVVQSCIMKKSFQFIAGQVGDTGSDCFIEQVRKANNNTTDKADIVGVFADIFTEFLLAPRFGTLEN